MVVRRPDLRQDLSALYSCQILLRLSAATNEAHAHQGFRIFLTYEYWLILIPPQIHSKGEAMFIAEHGIHIYEAREWMPTPVS